MSTHHTNGTPKKLNVRIIDSDLVERLTESGCWIWMGVTDKDGYGRLHGIGVHRTSYLESNGTIPEGMNVCHKCDVPSCINPAHLFLGSQADNLSDQRAKGRRVGKPPQRTTCKRGHALSGNNVLWRLPYGKFKSSQRYCRTCNNNRRKYSQEKLNG